MDTVDTRSASVPEDGEKIIEIQLERLRTFKNHPFKVRMDQEMIRLSASVGSYYKAEVNHDMPQYAN